MMITKRLLAKSVIWGGVGSLVMYLVAVLVTQDQDQSLTITLVYGVGRVFVYFAYDIVWSRIKWGGKDG